MKKLLITGASGFLGWNLCNYPQSEWLIYGLYNSHKVALPKGLSARIDLTNYREMKDAFQLVSPDAVIHTAAMVDDDHATVLTSPLGQHDSAGGSRLNRSAGWNRDVDTGVERPLA